MKIMFLQVGGTIDKDYPKGETNHGYNFEIGDPAFLRILRRVTLEPGWEADSIMRKDSLDMTDQDREVVRQHVEKSVLEERVVITHGTDTIHKTAEALNGIKGKTIVLTGAMLPEKFKDSDADFNLGMATAAVQYLPHGVYIVLYGRVKPWNEFKPH